MTTEERYGKLLLLRKTKDKVREQISDATAKYIDPFKDSLLKLDEEESKLQETIIADMEKRNIKTAEYEGQNITRSERRTMQIVDAEIVAEELKQFNKEVKKLTGMSSTEVQEALVIVTTTFNKKKALEIAEELQKVEGLEIKGIELKTTKFLTIK